MKTSYSNMAFSKGSATTENTSFKRYIGVATVNIAAVNPDAKTLAAVYDRQEIGDEPSYLSNYEGVDTCRVSFIVKTNPDKCGGIVSTNRIQFSLRNEWRYNRDKTKVQVIDKYGRTAWLNVGTDIAFNPSNEKQFKVLGLPTYSNGQKPDISMDCRPMYPGEEALEQFIAVYMNIPQCRKYVDGKWVGKSEAELAECECRLDHIESYFKGDFSEIKDIISYQPNNAIKVLFGIKTAQDGKQYTDVYTRMFLSPRTFKYDRLEKDVNDAKAAGSYPMTEFEVCDIKEYVVDPSKVDMPDFTATPEASKASWF